MPSQMDYRDLFEQLISPWLFMFVSVRHIPQAVYAIIASGNLHYFFSLDKFRETLFGLFWSTVGPQVKADQEERVVALLQGRVSEGVIDAQKHHTHIQGTVLEVGAGSGMWVDVLSRVYIQSNDSVKPDAPNKSKIYGIEPNPQSAAALRKRVADAGLDNVYAVLPYGIESLEETHIPKGSVDAIVSILCLCSIPDPEKNIRALYDMLKPGGRWYVYEHVRVSRGGPLLSLYQRFVDIPWSFLIGGCRLCRDTESSLLAAGSWSDIDLTQPVDEVPYKILPHIMGTLTK